MRTDGRTDMMNLLVAFHNFAKAPKKATKLPSTSCSIKLITDHSIIGLSMYNLSNWKNVK